MTRSSTLATAALAALGALALAGCSSSAKASAPTTTAPLSPTSAPATGNSEITQGGDARITAFVVPETVDCGGSTKTTVHVAYAVTHSARQQIAIDGLDVPGVTAPSGAVDAPVHCDGVPHTIALVAFDAKGGRTSQVKLLTTNLGG